MKKITAFLFILSLALVGCSRSPETISFGSSAGEFETLYDDAYFRLDNKPYHQEIALASFASAMASINEDVDYASRSAHLVDLWEKEGFKDIYINHDYSVKPRMDSIGFGIASKRIDRFNLVTVTIRSGGYDAEWASNFTVGESGNSYGFDSSASTVYMHLNEYILSHALTGRTKFWINGFSRGGAVANLLAGKILEHIADGDTVGKISWSKEDVYAYCFEAPCGANVSQEVAKSDLYQGIHNVVNFNDLVPMILPYEWNMVRYGHNHYYPDRLTDIHYDAKERKKMVSDYHFGHNAHTLPAYEVDDWKFYDPGAEATAERNLPRESIHPSLGRFQRAVIQELADYTLTRAWYTQFEEGIRNVFGTIYGYNPDIEGIDISKQLFVDILFSYSFVQTMFIELQQQDIGGFASDVEYLFYMIFNANPDNIAAIRKLYDDIYFLILFLAPGLVTRADLMHQFFSRDNLMILGSTHATELNYSFLRSADERLNGKDACKLNDGSYYILHIKTPSSVSIYESTLNKNVFSYKGESMSSDTLSAEKLADGSIDIYLPKNGCYEYHIESSSISLTNVDEYGGKTPVHDSLPKTGIISA